MEECEIDRKSSSAADLSFFGMENTMEGTSVSDAVLEHDLEARVSEGVRRDFSGSMESWPGGLGMKMDEVRVSESEAWNEGESGSDSSQMAPYSSSCSREAASASLMHGLQPGDMVWGKVKSHPWWPGHIFNEAFASPSVRRMKREGHMLVAFFGDSSYGWFDHTELIPFEPHFSEKSRQTNSRPFVKAVEEAVDELSRRGALALACRCRNPLNFRRTGVPGYFSVDVVGYEPGGIYSSKQIKKARDDFVPDGVLSFVNQLAVTPRRSESSKGIDWIRSMATLLAYRRAVFEEFDETYAQAFGVQPVRPSKNEPGMPDQADRIAPRAPLSGPLVIAEALGGKKVSGKSAPKASKAPSSKKNKYVLKRRDETPITGPPLLDSPASVQTGGTAAGGYHFDLAPGQQPQASVVISSLPAFREAAAAVSSSSPSSSSHIAAQHGDYVLQKRAPAEKPPPPTQALKRHEASRASGHGDTTDPARKERGAGPISKMEAFDAQQGFRTPDKPVAHPAARPHSVWEDFDDWMLKSQPPPEAHTEKPGRAERLESTEPTSVGFDESKSAVKLDSPVGAVDAGSDVWNDVKPPVDPKDKAETKMSEVSPGVRSAEGGAGVATVGFEPRHGKPQDSKVLDDDSTKKKSRKRPSDDTGDVKKKKKKKKDKAGIERLVIPREEEPHRKKAGKSIGVGLGNAELAQPELQSPYGPTAPPTKLDIESLDLKLPQLVADLSALALDPFHGIERDAPNIVRHVLLRFRSLVYQKSLIALPSGETEMLEVQAARPIAVPLPFEPGAGDIASGKGLKEKRELSATSKPSKPTSRPDGQTMIGRKRGPSDRQEEMSAKRNKKLNQVKGLPGEKKARIGQKAPEGEQRAPAKPLTAAEPVKKLEPPPVPRIPRPTFLVMKFPPRSTLPSVASLKAKFGRFGTLDLQGTRVFWKSFSCKVLYKYKSDAQAAYNHARNNDLFGQVKVEYALREVEGAPELLSDHGKRRPDSRADDGALFRPGNRNGGQMGQLGSLLYHQQQRQSSVQLKSILKKPGDEAAPAGGGNAKEIPRVKFMLGGDEEQVVAAASSNNNGGVSGNGEPISKNQKSVNFLPLPPPPPLLSLPNPPPLNTSPSQPSHLLGLQRLPAPRPPLLPCSEPPQVSHSLPPPRVADGVLGRGPAPFHDEARPHHLPRTGEAAGRGRSKVDISNQMLSLLRRCSDIVANLTSSLGYVPYHPL